MYEMIEPSFAENNRSPIIYALNGPYLTQMAYEMLKGNYTNILIQNKGITNMILSLKAVPFDVTKFFTERFPLIIGEFEISDLVTLPVYPNRFASTSEKLIAYFTFSRGSLDDILNNNFTDYDSLSTYNLYLPFIGYIDLAYSSIKNCEEINIEYYMDFSTCYLFCNVILNFGEYTLRIYENVVNVGHDIPIISTDSSSYIAGILSAASSLVTIGGVLTGNPVLTTVGSAGTVISQSASSNTTTQSARNPKTNRMNKISETTNQYSGQVTRQQKNWENNTYRNKFYSTGELMDGISAFINSRSNQGFTSVSNESSLLNSERTPYIIYKHPITNYFNGYDHMYGRPLSQYKVLSSMSGYTKLSSIHLNIPATTSELEEIESLLYEGVIINNGIPTPEPPVDPEPPIEPEPEPDPKPDPEPDPEPPEEYRPYEEGKEMICCFNGRFRVTSPRGWRTLNGVRDYHKGIDLVGEDSHVVYAICDGYCTTRTQYNDEGKMDGFGHYVTQTIADGRRIFYAHLASFSITDNQYVTAGTPIGIMGATGNVTGAHTHLELRPSGTTSESLDINAFTGIPNVVGNYTGVPTYAVAESAELQAKVGLENQTMEYLNKYEYAPDLIRKLNDKIE